MDISSFNLPVKRDNIGYLFCMNFQIVFDDLSCAVVKNLAAHIV